MLHNLIARKRRRVRSAMDVKKSGAILAGAILALGNFIWPVTSFAQRNRFNVENQNIPSLTSPSRELESLLSEVEQNIANKQWSEATYALGQILGIEDGEGQANAEFGVDRFYATKTSELGGEGKEIRGSLFQHVYGILDNLPDEAHKLLEVRHGLEAKKALKDATEIGDWEAVSRIASKYGFLEIGQDSQFLIANRLLAQGEAHVAAPMLERLMLQKRAFNRFGAPLGILSAYAYTVAGNQPKASEILKTTIASFPVYEGTIGTKSFRWTTNGDEQSKVETALKLLNSTTFKSFSRVTQTPLIVGGDSRRNADTLAGAPMPILRWHTELHESNQTKEKLAYSLRNKFQTAGDIPSTTIPTRVAISNGKIVLCSTYDQRIVAIDLETGLLLWECVYTGLPLGFSLSDLPEMSPADFADPTEGASETLIGRVWAESIYGNIAADNERLYGISDSSSLDITNASSNAAVLRMGFNSVAKTDNVLQCWSIAEEGKLLWEVGGALNDHNPELSNAYFLGAPLPYRGELLVIAEINGEINLVSLQPENGHLLWKQPLVQNEQTPVASDSLLRIIGASPTADGNVVLCPTLSGHLVAFDLQTKTLLWGLNYRTRVSNSAMVAGVFGQRQQGIYEPFMNRSVELSPVVNDGIAVYAPPDGFGIQAIELSSGKRLWQTLHGDKDSVRYVGAISGQCVLAVTQSAIVGLDKNTGVELWPKIQLASDSQVVGRGVRQGDSYYISLANQTILKVNLATGQSQYSTTLPNVPGNLIGVNDRLVSVSPFQMECYAIEEAFKRKVEAQKETDVQSAESLMDRGELELVLGDVEAALNSLEAAYKLDPKNQDCWIRLRQAAIAAVDLDFSKYAQRVKQYKIELENDPAFIRVEIASHLKEKQGLEALDKLFQLSDSRVLERATHNVTRDFVDLGNSGSVQEDRWIRTQIEIAAQLVPNLIPQSHGSKTDAQVDASNSLDAAQIAKVQGLVTSQKEKLLTLEPAFQRQKLNHLHCLPHFSEERVTLASKLIDSDLLLDAEQLLMDVIGDKPISQWFTNDRNAAIAIARIYSRSDRHDLIDKIANGDEQVLQQLKSTPEDQLLGAGNGLNADYLAPNSFPLAEPLFQVVPGASSSPELTPNVKDWPADRIHVDVAIQSPERNYDALNPLERNLGYSRPVSPLISVGETLSNRKVTYSGPTGAVSITSTSSPNGQRPIEFRIDTDLFKSGNGPIPSVAVDGKLILIGQGYLIALDTLDRSMNEEGPIWTQSFQTGLATVEQGRGIFQNSQTNSNASNAPKSAFYWGLPNQNSEFALVAASRADLIMHAGDEVIALDPHNGKTLWRLSGLSQAKIAHNDRQLFCLLPNSVLKTVDRRTGAATETTSFNQALVHCVVVGDKFLFADEAKSVIRLVRALGQEVLLERTLSADNMLSLTESKTNLLALGNNGDYFFWDLEDAIEHQHRVVLRNDELKEQNPDGRVFRANRNQISVVDFENQLLVLPYHSRFAFDDVEVGPGVLDASFAQVSGSIFAISPENGAPLWDKTLPVMQYAFPLQQERNGLPLAAFVRRFNLPRLDDGVNYQAVGFGLVDLRTGKVVFSRDGAKGSTPYHFHQHVNANGGSSFRYSGVTFTVHLGESRPDVLTRELGNFDYPTFRKQLIDDLRSRKAPAPNLDLFDSALETLSE